MRRIPLRIIAVALGGVLVHIPAAGQTHAELRGGLAVGSHTGTAAGLDIDPKLSYQALVTHGITPRFSVYGGYVRTAFGCKEGFCTDRDLTVSGSHGVLGGEVRAGPSWVRLGLLLGVTEVGTEGEPTDLGPGLQAGFGLRFGSGRVSFLPGLSYQWLSAKTSSDSDHAVAVSLDLGVGIRVGL